MSGIHALRVPVDAACADGYGDPDLFSRVGAFLAEQGLGPDPVNYAFAWHVVSDQDGALASAVAAMSEGGIRLSRHDIARLTDTPVAGPPVPRTPRAPLTHAAAQTAESLIARTQIQVDGFTDTVRAMHAETQGFGRDLAASAAKMQTANRSGLPIEEIAHLAGAMLARVRDAEARLDIATAEAAVLRTALDEARGTARLDSLTDLPNRRAFDEAFASVPTTAPVAVAICDIDHFKEVNDRFGHAVGDRVLRAIAQTLREACADQFVARYGGEEFAVLVTGLSQSETETLLETARDRIEAKRFRLRETETFLGAITISIGLATIEAESSLEHALFRADRALYVAKNQGRNRLVTCAG